ncbi:MAG TPA: 16S rRNA (guanine(966)-N(2))-methyltransferase RsmD [Actinomycetes bacterium]
MTRIIAGSSGGRRLSVPPGTSTRPTSDRAREALFSTLEALLGTLSGKRFLDLYSGSGAVGLEAVSRGASAALLVDDDRRALAALAANCAAVGGSAATVSSAAVERLVAGAGPADPYDVAFLDPPYVSDATDVRDVLEQLRANGWLAAGAVVVVERATRAGEWAWPPGFAPDRSRRYGEATLWYGRAAASEPPPQARP